MTTRTTKKPTLMGATEVAEYLDVSRQRVLELRQKNKNFPAPLEQLKSGPVWDKAEIDRFVENWDRTPGRPRKHPLADPPQTEEQHDTATSAEQPVEVAASDPEQVEEQPESQEEPVQDDEDEPEPEVDVPHQPVPEEHVGGTPEIPAYVVPETLRTDN